MSSSFGFGFSTVACRLGTLVCLVPTLAILIAGVLGIAGAGADTGAAAVVGRTGVADGLSSSSQSSQSTAMQNRESLGLLVISTYKTNDSNSPAEEDLFSPFVGDDRSPLFVRRVAEPICFGFGTAGDSDKLKAIAILKSSSSCCFARDASSTSPPESSHPQSSSSTPASGTLKQRQASEHC